MRARGNLPDLGFGLFLLGLALLAFYMTQNLNVGTSADMGPGYVPRTLGGIILVCGIGYVAKGLLSAFAPMPEVSWRPLLAILAAVAVFALSFQTAGLIVAVVGAIVVAGMAQRPMQLHVLVPFGAAVAAFSAALFVKGLGLPLKLWPWSW
jgi:putative tricarboxylic transport membrane protein